MHVLYRSESCRAMLDGRQGYVPHLWGSCEIPPPPAVAIPTVLLYDASHISPATQQHYWYISCVDRSLVGRDTTGGGKQGHVHAPLVRPQCSVSTQRVRSRVVGTLDVLAAPPVVHSYVCHACMYESLLPLVVCRFEQSRATCS